MGCRKTGLLKGRSRASPEQHECCCRDPLCHGSRRGRKKRSTRNRGWGHGEVKELSRAREAMRLPVLDSATLSL